MLLTMLLNTELQLNKHTLTLENRELARLKEELSRFLLIQVYLLVIAMHYILHFSNNQFQLLLMLQTGQAINLEYSLTVESI